MIITARTGPELPVDDPNNPDTKSHYVNTELACFQTAFNLISHQFATCVEAGELTMSFKEDYRRPQQQSTDINASRNNHWFAHWRGSESVVVYTPGFRCPLE